MTPIDFPQANCAFKAPPDLAESQVRTIRVFDGTVATGSMEGSRVIVTAWKPDARELAALNAGEPLFLSFIGLLPPHYPSVSFAEATQPA